MIEAVRRQGGRLDELEPGEEETHHLVWQRRICWPNPDATSIEGGCIWCEDARWRDFSTIERYARTAGILPNRGMGHQDALMAWQKGLMNTFWGRPPVRRVKRKRTT